MRIVVLDGHTLNPGDNPWTEVTKQGEFEVYDRTEADLIVSRAAEADIVLTNKTPLSGETMAQLPKLQFIAVLATGYNVVDVEAARERAIPVSNVPVYGTDSVAQFTFALLLELCHKVALHDRAVQDGEWATCPDFSFWKTTLIELVDKKMGIVGFGRIGRRVGELAHAFGMDVLAYDAFAGDAPDYQPFAWKMLDEIFTDADVVSLHCPQTADNVGLVNKRTLGLMKPDAVLINAARGGLVNEADLAEALGSGRIGGAAVDVVSSEPIRSDNPLLGSPHCIITPHMAWATLSARRRLMQTTADNIAAFIRGEPTNVVNP